MAVQPWKRIEPTIVTKIDRRHIVVKTFIAPKSGDTQIFATWLAEHQQSCAVIALTTDKKVIVAYQFRAGPEKMMYELPGGGIDEGEDPEVGVRRELLEETGYIPGDIKLLGTNSRDAYTNGTWHYYLATDCELSPDGQSLDENEEVEVKLLDIDEFLKIAKNDGTTDPAAVLMAYDELRRIAASA